MGERVGGWLAMSAGGSSRKVEPPRDIDLGVSRRGGRSGGWVGGCEGGCWIAWLGEWSAGRTRGRRAGWRRGEQAGEVGGRSGWMGQRGAGWKAGNDGEPGLGPAPSYRAEPPEWVRARWLDWLCTTSASHCKEDGQHGRVSSRCRPTGFPWSAAAHRQRRLVLLRLARRAAGQALVRDDRARRSTAALPRGLWPAARRRLEDHRAQGMGGVQGRRAPRRRRHD